MQTTSQTWHDLLAAGAPLQARATIGGVAYTDLSAPVINRALMQDRLSVGNVVSASLALAVRGAASIPRSASVVVEVRLNDGQTASEWLPQGTFYISRRMRDPVTGLLALECYDALLKANAVWTPSAGAWPRTMAAVVAELAALLGVTLDSRTVIPSGAVYVMAEPAEGTTIRDALSVVAQAAGGNWIMTPGNRLRLVRVGESGGTVDVTGVVGGIDVGQAGTVTGVRSTVDGVVSLVGDDTGIVVDVAVASMIAADMAEALIGQAYTPFQLSGAIYDPAAELGDGVRAGAGGEVVSALCSEEAAYGPAFRGDIAAPDPGEVTDEYPYIGNAERTLALAKAAVTEAVDRLDDELTQQEIFNRLTDNGAAQGLVLYNGQLYINASYIQSGSLNVGFIDFNAPVNDFDVPDENNPDTLLEGQAVENGWIVNTTGLPQICALNCVYAKLLRGRTITLTFTFNGTLTKCASISQTLGGDVARTDIEPEHPTNPYTYQFTVPDNSDKFGLYMYCDGLKQISATVSGPQIVYPDDIKFSYAGLQIGHFMVDRSGIVQTKRRISVEGGLDYPETRRVTIASQGISLQDLDSEDDFHCNIARDRILIGKGSSSTASQVPTIMLSDSGPGDEVIIRSDRGIEIRARVDGSHRTVAYLRGNGLYTAGYLSAGDAATTRANLGITPANIGAVSTSDVINVAHGGTGANNKPDAISNLFDVGINQPSDYPDKPGIYRVIRNIFANLVPASYYGTLVIFQSAYGLHTFLDSYGNLYYGFSGDIFGEPTTWHRGVIDSEVIDVAHGGTGVTQGTIDITDYCTFPTGNVNTFSPYGGRLYYNPYLNCVFGTITMNDGASVNNQADIVYLKKDSSGTVLSASREAACGTCVHSAVSPIVTARITGNTIKSSHTLNTTITGPRYTIMAFLG